MASLRRLGFTKDLRPIGLGVAGIAAVLLTITALPDRTLPGVFLLAVLLGGVFVWYDYGFTAGFRQFLSAGDGRTLAAGFVVPAVASALVIPVGSLVDGYHRFLAPVGLPLIVGAFIFGIGMQTANACGSGTLISASQGSRRALVALPFFCGGGVIGSLTVPWAMRLPGLGIIDLTEQIGIFPALAATEGALLLGALTILRGARPSHNRLWVGAKIGLLAGLLFLVSHEPWGITVGLTTWGAKALRVMGLDVSGFEFWRTGGASALLEPSILTTHGSLSDIGVLLGAFLGAAAKGSVGLGAPIAWRPIAGAALGGLMMGFGARLSFGCNVGAFLGGVSSGSLHGAIWFLAVLPGCWVGIQLRPLFGFLDEIKCGTRFPPHGVTQL